MTVTETYNYITRHMTAEQALMKLLKGHVRAYEHLKFNDGEELHPTMVASLAALDMGWDIAIPNNDPDSELQGMVIGTSEYINEIFAGEDSDGYDCGEDCDCDKCVGHW